MDIFLILFYNIFIILLIQVVRLDKTHKIKYLDNSKG